MDLCPYSALFAIMTRAGKIYLYLQRCLFLYIAYVRLLLFFTSCFQFSLFHVHRSLLYLIHNYHLAFLKAIAVKHLRCFKLPVVVLLHNKNFQIFAGGFSK